MAGYVIVESAILDAEKFEEYKRAAAPTVAAYGGRYLVRGGAMTVEEGTWHPRRLVVLEFESAERARQWIHSPEYQAVKPLRQGAAEFNVVVVEG
ncbi:MAG TPA: DUF1330 domain-containing protein [Thermoanaerobaculia bacterium]|jgi:uncharacterized protein (DUF1330 family)|nr:DUF1330 domain-containing protein [Thermoanaerobaculia bacterium]